MKGAVIVQKKKNALRFLKYLPAVVLIVFIFGLGILLWATPKADYSSTEKRYLQKFPEVSPQSVFGGEFEEDFENYLADHFFARNFWMGANSYYNLLTGRNGVDGVYCGNDGWLINVPVEEKDSRVQENIDSIAKFKNKISVPVTVEIVPSTGFIMEDKLSENHFKYNDNVFFSQLIDACNKNSMNFVDLRESFSQNASKGEQLYYKTDHHWTTEGAYNGYRELCTQWGIEPTPKENFEIEEYGGFYGTTYSKSGFWFTPPDSVQIWNNPRNDENSISVDITEGTQTTSYNSMFFLNHLEEDDKYPVFLDGNHALEKITNSNAPDGKLLVIKDSFSHCFAPFLADNFSEVTLVDLRYYKNSVSDLVNSGDFDRVLVLYGIDNFAADTDLAWLK